MNKRAIIIGASSGIGREVAKLLMKEGWTIGVAARRVDKLQELNAAAVEQIDVTKDDATTRLQSLINCLGGMDLFFYASGIGKQNRELQEDIELATVYTNGLGFTRMIGEAYRSSPRLLAPKASALPQATLPPKPCRMSTYRRWNNKPTPED